ncbi:hypothetical protein [Alicyclobacillus sp. SO9]|uniref:hypothetical protein n=1 Tax=Alicyclobacillus sp. SO9 TaxID=2665646 RepID=UPI0018E8FF47|nr:hypothetical protein [Alicyclobacillus sp. SO9]QQE79704.1 hypothetical protein GI364_04230 [Alicyclobacillus sp. SO9]
MKRWNGVAVVLGIVGLISGCGTQAASSQAKNNVTSRAAISAVTNTAGMQKTEDQYLHGMMYATLNKATSQSQTKGSTKSTPSKSPAKPSSSKSTDMHTSRTTTTAPAQTKTSSSSSSGHHSSGTSTATTKPTSPSSSGSKTATSTQSTSSSPSNHTTSSSGTKTTTKSTSGGSTSKTSSMPTNTKPKTSGEDVWATNYLNSDPMPYSGKKISYFDNLTSDMAKGTKSQSAVKTALNSLTPWEDTLSGTTQKWAVSEERTWVKNFSSIPNTQVGINNWFSNRTLPVATNPESCYWHYYVWYNATTKKYTLAFLEIGLEAPKVSTGA